MEVSSFMKKTIKLRKLVVLLVVITMLSTIAFGCKSDDTDDENVLTVGVLGPMTGPGAHVGEQFKAVCEMEFEKIDYKVGPYKIKLKYIDDESNPEKATRTYEEAIVKDKIQCGILGWNSEVSLAVMDVVAKYQIPHFYSLSTTKVINEKALSDPDKYKVYVAKWWASPGKTMMGYAEAINLAIENGTWSPNKKVLGVYGVDNDWGRDFGEEAIKVFKDYGWEIVGPEFTPMGETDFYPLLKKFKDNGATLLIGTCADPAAVSSFCKQADELGVPAIRILDGLGWFGDWYQLTGDSANYVLDLIPQLTKPEAKEFRDNFKDRFGYEPGPSNAGLAYDAVCFFIENLQDCYDKYGKLDKETLLKYATEEVQTGKVSFTNGILMDEYVFTDETWPDPEVGVTKYFIPVIQYFEGKGTVIWPEEYKQADIVVPDYAK
jgi:branched-chain amino acid transport system substrate-binding protein